MINSAIASVLPAPELTVVVPTFNERDNVSILIERLTETLNGFDWEVLFVDDDSPDGTANRVREIGLHDRRVRCIRRIGRRGLAGACIEGMLASQSKFVAVIDGDLQHDESRLKHMLEKIRGDFDLVVATRYIDGGSLASFSLWRARISRWSTGLARRFLGVSISDPMSGFFMVRRSIIDEIAPKLMTEGFKILLDIISTSSGKLRVAEVTYSFRERGHGESKLDARIALDFVSLVANKLSAGMISARFILFTLVGLTGLGLHMILLRTGMLGGIKFELAQALSTVLVIAYNFILNNSLTYRDQRLVGSRFFIGLLRFEIVCSVGLISNVGIASWVYGDGNGWWVAGLLGALMGAVWNYVASAAFVWRTQR